MRLVSKVYHRFQLLINSYFFDISQLSNRLDLKDASRPKKVRVFKYCKKTEVVVLFNWATSFYEKFEISDLCPLSPGAESNSQISIRFTSLFIKHMEV